MVECVHESIGQLDLSGAVLVIAFFSSSFGPLFSFLELLEASIVREALSTIS
jgi:hypothetical protein